jgi:hypothetical protein
MKPRRHAFPGRFGAFFWPRAHVGLRWYEQLPGAVGGIRI